MQTDVMVTGSLRNRLALILTGGAAVLALIVFVAVRALAAQIAQQGQDRILSASVSSILDTAVIRDGQIAVDFPYAALSMLSTDADDRVFYAISEEGRLLSGYGELVSAPDGARNQRQFTTSTFNGEAIRVTSGTRTLIGAEGQRTVTVSVAQTKDALAETLRAISRNVAALGLGFFVLATALALWAAATTSAQLHRLTTSITRRGPQDLSPVSKPIPSEMVPLVGSLNTLMARLDLSLSQSEDFIAEAAHRIRTPLATVRSHAETTLQRVDNPDNRNALHAMIRAIDESSRAASQLLDHAMVTFRAENLTPEPVELTALLQDLAMRMTPIAEMKDIALVLDAPAPALLTGDPILLQNAFRNLIDNALKYAPADTTVTIAVRATPDIEVAISDQGAGFAPDEIDTLAGRFVRGKDTGNKIGSGLGLTIAQAVTQAHGGRMYLNNVKGGGACVTLQF